MYVTDGLLFQATDSCRVKNSSPLRFHLNSSPREAVYESSAKSQRQDALLAIVGLTHILSQYTTKLIH